jgi:hypothetical protein
MSKGISREEIDFIIASMFSFSLYVGIITIFDIGRYKDAKIEVFV